MIVCRKVCKQVAGKAWRLLWGIDPSNPQPLTLKPIHAKTLNPQPVSCQGALRLLQLLNHFRCQLSADPFDVLLQISNTSLSTDVFVQELSSHYLPKVNNVPMKKDLCLISWHPFIFLRVQVTQVGLAQSVDGRELHCMGLSAVPTDQGLDRCLINLCL